MGFCHLHVHTDHSVLDGMCQIEELIVTAKELGQSAIAITDHGSASGLFFAQEMGEKHGVKIILGTEFYTERPDGKRGHLIVLAKNNKGLENLYKLHEFGYVNNFYYKPRINFNILKYHSEGLIVTSACLASEINQSIMKGDIDEAVEIIRQYKGLFGNDFYLEIQPNNIPEQYIVNKTIVRLAKQENVQLVATNDVHYIKESDYFAHEVLLGMQINKKYSDEKRWKFPSNDFWLKTKEEMIETFIDLPIDDVMNAINNTKVIADKCNAYIEKKNYLPVYYDIPEGKTERDLLVEKVTAGAREKEYTSFLYELQNEINIIDRNGYSGYFLIVQDYVTSARDRGIIVGDGRGSGAGSKVAFVIDITRVDPNKYGLLFERFMADGREPDFDVDFSDQEDIFFDLQSKYGKENVAKITTFGTMTPKSVTRKVLSFFEHQQSEINQIAKLIDDGARTMEEAYDNKALVAVKNKYKTEFEIIERLEGMISHLGQHAGGIIIANNLSGILPVRTLGEDRNKRIVQFDKNDLEAIGHYKFDILGLDTLPVIKNTLESIKDAYNIEIDLHDVDYDDENVYDMLCEGDVSGVFQLSAQKTKVLQQQPRVFEDLIAINALIRPGIGDWNEYIHRRKGKSWKVHQDRMEYMKETEGIITYQEQFLLDCKTFAGWNVAFSDKRVRKNKDIDNDVELKEKFITDTVNNGYSKELAEAVWMEICESVSGGYSFNKSHAASYAVLTYHTAWLKHYYPIHYYAAIMSSEGEDGKAQNAISQQLSELKTLGIPLLPPNINESEDHFKPTSEGIMYKINAITNVGVTALRHIFELRPIESFDDFMERRVKSQVKTNTVEALIKAGCFDFDNPNRAELLWKLDMANRTNRQIKEDFQCEKYKYSDKIKAGWERDVLGLYLSSHPLEKYGFESIEGKQNDQSVVVGGEISEVAVIRDKNKNEMAFIQLDTLFGNIKVIVFASAWKIPEVAEEMSTYGNIVLVKGVVSNDSVLYNSHEILEQEEI